MEKEFDVLVGINLLREGLDLPEVGLVAILDADKEGYLRSFTSLIQTIGRAARNLEGHVIMYADRMTDSMERAIDETKRRRDIQRKFNEDNGITPESIVKAVYDIKDMAKQTLEEARGRAEATKEARKEVVVDIDLMEPKEVLAYIKKLEDEMIKAAKQLEFEKAASIRDEIRDIRRRF